MTEPPKNFLRLPQVVERSGLSKSVIKAKVRAGEFPQPFRISERAVAWTEDDIVRWQAKCIETRKTFYRRVRLSERTKKRLEAA
ncbi:helix-turn-helix transcriptional regulator [Pseudorhodoplanes sp.]|uniref:helix-turn-helix transcriptional regulator n=1 Tax=Pseudorhodoplanes sp. TaxID=1934341 RepID=UPI003D0D60B8